MSLHHWITPEPWAWGDVAQGTELPEPPAPAERPDEARTDDTREG